ncbi:hypothetical protein AMS68_001974 [Peltaster fructicola]|uniref:Radical SAM core domain-containing protein n=1 Tax=Peltaster fructicola TaxID=286661 RepID=A0A6H0XNX0_9PEZI|nr:hypothetical protein AMS68_001974 [Peltaster fructicola]
MMDNLALKLAAYSVLFCILLSYIIWNFLQGHLADDPIPLQTPAPEADPTTASNATSDITSAPISVNYHFTRKCNKTCVFCFHTDKTSHVASDEEMQRGLRLLKDAGMKKINFAGGEPFLYPARLAMLCKFCKEDLNLESVSIISNGTKITQGWLQKYGRFVDVLGVSCDSFDEETNIKIGRGNGSLVPQLFKIRQWCRELNIMFKLNTVVLTWNWEEDMATTVTELAPDRWKVFQVLSVEGENDSAEAETELDKRKRNVKNVLITDEQFKAYCDRHKEVPNFVPESNDLMASSYIILDEYLRFLDKGNGPEKHSSSILDVGVDKAFEEVHFDRSAFSKRGGIYNWSKEKADCTTTLPPALEF